ncbi:MULTISPECIES: LysE family translocator [unclassified Acinetobacter]|uniref:LysE family translocator n=1 Tax=unclassified Acinetobacter TaxID=196816 RepID=UPI002934BFFA|nr:MULTISPECIES: LysE family transporter [unclassified Acinetobacter]WOE30739.1 LysE family transporter [Acinetobacter sp. SAAs470]WOE38932.1 LysE family transporter [Acinetobacter sp. SAAs474]
MIENWLFVLAIIAILMIPGPTNALLASSAHQQGIIKTSLFIPAELFGYLYAISIWALFIHIGEPTWPHLVPILHILSIIYVGWLAFRLWKLSYLEQYNQQHHHIRPRQLFFATFKNPKALLFAAGIFPDQTWNSVAHCLWVYLVFSIVLIPTAIFWMAFGRAILAGKTDQIKAAYLYKGSALILILCMLPIVIGFF